MNINEDKVLESIIKRLNTVKRGLTEKSFDLITLAMQAMKLNGVVKETMVLKELDHEEFKFKSFDDLNLRGLVIKNKIKTDKWVIGVHGYTGNSEDTLQRLAFIYEMGFNLFLFDFRNHGESEGNLTTFGINEKEDLKSAINYLNQNYDVSSIGLYGFSMGAFTLNYFSLTEQEFANESKVKYGIADCPYKSIVDLVQSQAKFLFALFQRFDLGDKIFEYYKTVFQIDLKDASCNRFLGVEMDTFPIIFIHGKNDMITNYQDSIDLYEGRKLNTKKDELVIFENGPHVRAFNENTEKYISSVKDFLNSQGII